MSYSDKIVLPKKLKYSTGYKHKSEDNFSIYTGIIPPKAIGNGFVSLNMVGEMTIAKNYAWNGASGPVFETKNSIIGSMFHDGGYQLIRERLLPIEYRSQIDDLFYHILVASGMWPIRAAIWHLAVAKFGLKHALPAEPEILEAP